MADVNGTGIRYKVTGGGDPLLLIHAGIADNRTWEPQIEAFSRRFRVVRYDMRGARRVTMTGVAHPPNMESPEEFNAIVLNSLAEQR